MGNGLRELPFEPEKTDPNLNLTEEQLMQKIQETQNQIAKEKESEFIAEPQVTPAASPQVTPQVPQVPQVPEVPQAIPQQTPPPQVTQGDKVSPEQPKPTEQVPAGQQQVHQPEVQPPKVEQKPESLTPEQFKELMAKKNMTPEQLAKIYVDLEKDYHKKSGELAALKKQQATPVQTPQQPDQIPGMQPQRDISSMPINPQGWDNKENFLQDLGNNPILTFATLNQIFNKDLVQKTQQQDLHTTVVGLSSSPKTAPEFNLPEVQTEIDKVLKERPEMMDNLSGNLPVVTDIAIGRLYRSGKLNKDAVEAGRRMAEQNLLQRQAVGMETTGKPPAPPQPLSPEQMTPENLWKLILQVQKNITQG